MMIPLKIPCMGPNNVFSKTQRRIFETTRHWATVCKCLESDGLESNNSVLKSGPIQGIFSGINICKSCFEHKS